MIIRFLSASFIVLALGASPALAQYGDSSDAPDASTARLEVKLSQMEEQLRRMEGTIEQLSYQNKQLKSQMEKGNSDTQYRLQALEKQSAAALAPVAAPQTNAAASSPESPDAAPSTAVASDTENGEAVTPATPAQQFATPRDHYNYAFRLMNQAKYAEAGASFASFTKQYPHDPLAGNAFYWLGETYYVRRDYIHAADDFRQGYEAMPSGPKGADNLLKLAMSMEALKKDKEACVVLKQVTLKYDATNSIRPRAEQEINRLGCNN